MVLESYISFNSFNWAALILLTIKCVCLFCMDLKIAIKTGFMLF